MEGREEKFPSIPKTRHVRPKDFRGFNQISIDRIFPMEEEIFTIYCDTCATDGCIILIPHPCDFYTRIYIHVSSCENHCENQLENILLRWISLRITV